MSFPWMYEIDSCDVTFGAQMIAISSPESVAVKDTSFLVVASEASSCYMHDLGVHDRSAIEYPCEIGPLTTMITSRKTAFVHKNHQVVCLQKPK
jgi:hypothetical protein